MNWQKIETAPKDGTWILLMGFEKCLYGEPLPPAVVAFWCDDPPLEPIWAFCYWDGDWRSNVENPTHWMPLPEPPQD